MASGCVAQGREVAAFEEEVAAVVGRRHGVAVSSGTAALHLALTALGVGHSDRVLIPSYVCAALYHAVRAVDAEVQLADVDGTTGNLDSDHGVGDAAAAIVPHMFGRPAAAVAGLARRTSLIEDLAMALGTTGVGTTGIAAVCSFYATKVITSGGEGGMVLTDDDGLAQAVRGLREYDGLAVDRRRHNYKLTDVAAAIGRVQLDRLDELISRRRSLAALYDRGLADLPVWRPPVSAAANHFRYVIGFDGDIEVAIAGLARAGITAHRPVPEPLHRALQEAGDFAGTDRMWRTALSVPLYPALEDADAERIVGVARAVLSSGGPA